MNFLFKFDISVKISSLNLNSVMLGSFILKAIFGTDKGNFEFSFPFLLINILLSIEFMLILLLIISLLLVNPLLIIELFSF